MNEPRLHSANAVTLIGGGPVCAGDLRLARARAPTLMAADGGADRALQLGVTPEAVIGDLDSISQKARAQIEADRLLHLSEQASTDFDKALRVISAPFILGIGFSGGRLDHALAALHGLVRAGPKPVILIGRKDLCFAAPPGAITLQLRPGDPLSLFPLAAVTGESVGLEWPIHGLNFAPDRQIGTSNRVTAARVRLQFGQSGMLVILPRRRLDAAIAGLLHRAD